MSVYYAVRLTVLFRFPFIHLPLFFLSDLNFVVVAARDDERLGFVEVHPSHGPVVLVEPEEKKKKGKGENIRKNKETGKTHETNKPKPARRAR